MRSSFANSSDARNGPRSPSPHSRSGHAACGEGHKTQDTRDKQDTSVKPPSSNRSQGRLSLVILGPWDLFVSCLLYLGYSGNDGTRGRPNPSPLHFTGRGRQNRAEFVRLRGVCRSIMERRARLRGLGQAGRWRLETGRYIWYKVPNSPGVRGADYRKASRRNAAAAVQKHGRSHPDSTRRWPNEWFGPSLTLEKRDTRKEARSCIVTRPPPWRTSNSAS